MKVWQVMSAQLLRYQTRCYEKGEGGRRQIPASDIKQLPPKQVNMLPDVAFRIISMLEVLGA